MKFVWSSPVSNGLVRLACLPCLDSPEHGAARKRELDIPWAFAADLGRSAVEISRQGFYVNPESHRVNIQPSVKAACAGKRSIRPEDDLPEFSPATFTTTRVQVSNETTFGASRRFISDGRNPVALNFANGVSAGGGFLSGARAQEEVLCRSSALFVTLVDDPMYHGHRMRPEPDSTAWSIYSPKVPVFRADDGAELSEPWPLSFITCAAPYAPDIGQPESGDLLQIRIRRILAIARAFGYSSLVLGAWGCGAFGNDPERTARDFRTALETEFAGSFSDVVFAIADWSPQRKFLGPFRDVFAMNAH